MAELTQPLIVVTGAAGFIGKNLAVRLRESGHQNVGIITRQTAARQVDQALSSADFVFHLAGVNRPSHPDGFRENADLTSQICEALTQANRRTTIVLAS